MERKIGEIRKCEEEEVIRIVVPVEIERSSRRRKSGGLQRTKAVGRMKDRRKLLQ